MATRALSLITFWLLESLIILASLVVVLCFYFPFVALKAVWVALRSKRGKVATSEPAATQS